MRSLLCTFPRSLTVEPVWPVLGHCKSCFCGVRLNMSSKGAKPVDECTAVQ